MERKYWPGPKPSTLSQPAKARVLCSQVRELLSDRNCNPALHTCATYSAQAVPGYSMSRLLVYHLPSALWLR